MYGGLMHQGNSISLHVRQAFSERFRTLLIEKELLPGSYTHIAKIFQVSPKAIRRWLEGTATPNQHRLYSVSEYFGVHIKWLLLGEGECYKNSASNQEKGNIFISNIEVEMLDGYRKLLPNQQACFVQLLRSM